MENIYGEFQKFFVRDEKQAHASLRKPFWDERIKKLPGLQGLFDAFSGESFNGGVYRILLADEVTGWEERIAAAFRIFAIDLYHLDTIGSSLLLPGCGARAPARAGDFSVFQLRRRGS